LVAYQHHWLTERAFSNWGHHCHFADSTISQISPKSLDNFFLPILLSLAMLIWAIAHYALFAHEPGQQFKELTSTWLRVFEAILIGAAAGLVIQNHPRRAQFLWLGIFCSFAYLFGHYLSAYSQSGQLFMPNYYFTSPFGNKINTVLMGGLFISAICGSSAATLLHNQPQYRWPIYCFWVLGVCLILFAFTTIIDTRNGVGVGIILLSSWALFIGYPKYCVKFVQENLIGKLVWQSLYQQY